MFNHLTVKELKGFIQKYREQVMVTEYSHLRKADLITWLESRFILRDGNLYLKSSQTTNQPAQQTTTIKTKKRITPELVQQPVQASVIPPVQ